MLKAKINMTCKVVLMLCLVVAVIAPTYTVHVYAANAWLDTLSFAYETETTVEEVNVSEKIVIEHDTIEIKTSDLFIGDSYITVQGQDGIVSNNYAVRYENGVEVSRVLLSEEMLVKPVDTIKYVGTKVKPETKQTFFGTWVTKPTSYRNSFTVSCTAYDLSYESCGKRPGDRGYGITASGMRAGVGVVAVDPRVIPLGTKLYIEAVDGSWTYGYAIAGDTGGAIKGNRVDLFFNTYSECIQFGRRNARVYILN